MGAWLNPPAVCERLEAIVSRFGGAMAAGAGAGGRVEYALPVHATEEMRAYLRTQASVIVEKGFWARLPGGRVFGSGIVLSPDGRSIARDVSEDFGKRFEEHWLLTYPRIRKPETVSGRTAVVATTQGVGYGHWLLEELPRLLAADLRGCDAIIANVRERFAVEALGRSGFGGKVIAVRRDHHLQCEELIVPSLCGPAGWPVPEAVRLVEEFGATVGAAGASAAGERIYVSRARAKRRRVTNEEALWAMLEGRGFKQVFLEEMTWAEQIGAFRGAREIVAAHGAGLANLVFCEAGTRVVELFHRAYVNPCYWRLAALKGLDYRPVVEEGKRPLAQELEANKRDIAVDVAAVGWALG